VRTGLPVLVMLAACSLQAQEPAPSPSAAPASPAPPAEASQPPPTAQAVVKRIQAGEFEAGLTDVEAALAATPDNARLWYLKGFILANLKRPDEAAEAAGKALSIKPDFEGANLLLARLQEDLGQFEIAVEHYRKELETAKSVSVRRDAYLGLAETQLRLKKVPDAIVAYEQVLKIAPGHMGAMQLLAELYSKSGRKDEADALLDRVAILKSNDPQKLYDLASSRHSAGDLEAAAAYLRKAIQIKDDFADAHRLLGQTLVSLKMRDQAAEELKRYLELATNPDDPAVADAKKLLDELTKYDDKQP
jgi:tetratricopeptide (TPR) repeat protein